MISLQKAQEAINTSIAKANELGIKITVSIVDTHGSTIATARMDGSIPISPKFAYEKAYTSANLGMATKDLAQFATEGKPYFGLTAIFGGKITTIAGGMPVMMDGKLIGGVGVGGSMDVSQDHVCAEAAALTLSR